MCYLEMCYLEMCYLEKECRFGMQYGFAGEAPQR